MQMSKGSISICDCQADNPIKHIQGMHKQNNQTQKKSK